MGDAIHIKPHHFIDIITSFGRGQVDFRPHPYGHAVHTIAARVLDDRDAPLVMDLGADDICRPCTHNIDGLCDDSIDTSFRPEAPSSKREWNLMIDRRWCERLAIEEGDRLTASEFCEKLRDLAGDITDIYREIPSDRTAERASHLVEGVKRFLTAP